MPPPAQVLKWVVESGPDCPPFEERASFVSKEMVPAKGLEPLHSHEYQILSLARLPIPPRRLLSKARNLPERSGPPPFKLGSSAAGRITDPPEIKAFRERGVNSAHVQRRGKLICWAADGAVTPARGLAVALAKATGEARRLARCLGPGGRGLPGFPGSVGFCAGRGSRGCGELSCAQILQRCQRGPAFGLFFTAALAMSQHDAAMGNGTIEDAVVVRAM